jgi:hypothetical protein
MSAFGGKADINPLAIIAYVGKSARTISSLLCIRT